MSKRNSLYSLLFTIFNDGLGWGIVLVIFAPLLFDRSESFLPYETTDAVRNIIVSTLISSYAITQFFAMPIIGSLSDHFGRKKILLWTLLGAALSFIASALAIVMRNLPLLFIARLLAGLFSANVSTAQASIADLSTEKNKAKNLSLTGIVGGLSWIIGPPIGGILATPKWVSWFNYAVPFWFTAVLFLLNFLWIYKSYSETYERGGRHDWKQEIRNLAKVSKIPRMGGWLAIACFFYIAWFLFILYFPTLFVLQFEFSQDVIGLFSGYMAVFWMLASFAINRWLGEKFDSELMVLYILPILGVAFLIVTSIGNIPAWLAAFPILSIGASMTYILMMAITSNLAGKENQGKVFGLIQSLSSLGVFVAPLCSGLLANIDLRLPLYSAACLLLALFFFALGLYVRAKKRKVS